MNINQELLSKLEEPIIRRKQEIISFLQESIQTPSVSGHEGEYAELIAEKMNKLGYDKVWIDDIGNVVGIIKGNQQGKTLLYNGHLDHVPPGEMETPYSAKILDGTPFGIEGDIIWGRAASDMKGALAGMVMAGGILIDAGIQLNGDLIISGVIMEELLAHTGAKYLVEIDNIRADAALIGEATNLDISLGHRSNADIIIQTHGKMAHASTPKRGINALRKMMLVSNKLQKLENNLPHHSILGQPTFPITMMSIQPNVINVIPDLCTAHANFRGHPDYDIDEFLNELTQIKSDLTTEDPELSIDFQLYSGEETSYTGVIEKAVRHMFSFYTNPADPFVGMTEMIVELILNKKPELTTWKFATDGGYLSHIANIPTIGFGPGDERFTHSTNDLIKIQDVITATKIYTALPLTYCGFNYL